MVLTYLRHPNRSHSIPLPWERKLESSAPSPVGEEIRRWGQAIWLVKYVTAQFIQGDAQCNQFEASQSAHYGLIVGALHGWCIIPWATWRLNHSEILTVKGDRSVTIIKLKAELTLCLYTKVLRLSISLLQWIAVIIQIFIETSNK